LPELTGIKAEFEAAIKRVNELPSQPTNVQLELYGFYKQALFGDITGERPGRLNVRARAKYDEWANKKGMFKEEAMKKYIEIVKRLEKSQK
jgi:acyl-CoA-binding protein